jgi:hypothetical protein
MGSLVQNKLVQNYGFACSEAMLVNIGIEFVVFTTNCICGFYHH